MPCFVEGGSGRDTLMKLMPRATGLLDGALGSGSIALYTWGNGWSYFDDVVVAPLSGGPGGFVAKFF